MLLPSTRQLMISARFDVVSLFMPSNVAHR
jgi:hypothetical protein